MREVVFNIHGGKQCTISSLGRLTVKEPFFTIIPSQLKTLTLLAQGLPYLQIAEKLGRSDKYLRQQIKSALISNSVHTKKSLIKTAEELDLLNSLTMEGIRAQQRLFAEAKVKTSINVTAEFDKISTRVEV